MKIVDRDTFLKMPRNTLYNEYENGNEIISEFYIKGDTVEITGDYFSQEINFPLDFDGIEDYYKIFDPKERDTKIMPLDFHCEERAAMFNEDQLYIVWDKNDVKMLIERLKECL